LKSRSRAEKEEGNGGELRSFFTNPKMFQPPRTILRGRPWSRIMNPAQGSGEDEERTRDRRKYSGRLKYLRMQMVSESTVSDFDYLNRKVLLQTRAEMSSRPPEKKKKTIDGWIVL
jgi:hypothetical protein